MFDPCDLNIDSRLQLVLSQPPTDVTVEKAKSFLDAVDNPPPPPPGLTWADILAEEPFEGEHWEGILAPSAGRVRSGSGKDKEVQDEWDSTPSLSPLNSDDLALDDDDDSFSSADYDDIPSFASEQPAETLGPPSPAPLKPPSSFEHRKQFEELQGRQYWRDDWHTDAPLRSKFDIGDPSTLGRFYFSSEIISIDD